jgi:hypothetical protein
MVEQRLLMSEDWDDASKQAHRHPRLEGSTILTFSDAVQRRRRRIDVMTQRDLMGWSWTQLYASHLISGILCPELGGNL